MNSLEQIARQLEEHNNYLLVGHAIPDGDCIGSLLALYQGLQVMGKEVRMLLQHPIPAIYGYLPGFEMIELPEKMDAFNGIAVFLDCSDQERVDQQALKVLSSPRFTINLDHHQSNNHFADFNYVDSQAAATAEIIYTLLQELKVEITPGIAAALYAGIIMDTGSFLNGNTTPASMSIAADLISKGADVNQARINLFESKPWQEIMLLRVCLQHMEMSEDGKIASITLAYEDLAAIGATAFFPEGIINYTRMIAGVEVGLLFRETEPGQVKIGFRSKDNVNVAALAAKFDGGGHKQAAGARRQGKLDEVKAMVIQGVKDVIG
ncbi:MAG: bifunctional oligoribonuclease/PAP phosphatase NrnA [Syntrophomonadaceae bacterium]|nr:bifunctional oligoribonuclease/PAP phosphatase NrnA [Syntrophomonadaceae bacterium]